MPFKALAASCRESRSHPQRDGGTLGELFQCWSVPDLRRVVLRECSWPISDLVEIVEWTVFWEQSGSCERALGVSGVPLFRWAYLPPMEGDLGQC
jgi:hypothetical protein